MNTTTLAINQIKVTSVLSFFENIFTKIEQFRIRTHLRIVEQELRRKNVKHLSFELQQEREKNISRLHDYWLEGLYPKNPDFNKRTPYFKDYSGTLCAMAYLIAQSGHENLVNQVARTNNNIYINDIHSGPVIDWINKSGLTKAEAARVQPTYGPCGDFSLICTRTLVPLIISGVIFILMEWLSYKFAKSLSIDNKAKRLGAWFYFSVTNLLIAVIIWWFLLSNRIY